MIPYETVDEARSCDAIGARNGFIRRDPGDAETVAAEINQGRWIGRCKCNGARWVSPDRPMFCPLCGSVARVVFPTDADDIAATLECRPTREAMNWSPSAPVPGRGRNGETLDDLLAENLERGVSVPVGLLGRATTWVVNDWAARGLTAEMSGFNPDIVAKSKAQKAAR